MSQPTESRGEDIRNCAICSEILADAVLLKCLHSACRSCSDSNHTGGVTCRVCQVITETWAMKTNLLVSALVQRSIVTENDIFCAPCVQQENQHVAAKARCYTCQLSLCRDCVTNRTQLHSTHTVVHLKDRTNVSEEYLPPPRLCTKHYEELKFVCFSCKDGRCAQCVPQCFTSSHDVLHLDSYEALERKTECMKQINSVLACLNSSVNILDSHLSYPDKVDRAREESLATHEKAKETALQSISNAHRNAAKSLLTCWTNLAEKSLGLTESAKIFKARVHWTQKYCRLVLHSNDLLALLLQLDAVFSSVRQCLDDARQYKEPVDPAKLVRCNVMLPSDLDSIACGWFDSAKVVSDDFNSSLNDLTAEDSIDYQARNVLTQNEVKQLLEQHKEGLEQRERDKKIAEQLHKELAAKMEQLVATSHEKKKLLEQQKKLQKRLERQREQLRSGLRSKTQKLVATENEKTELQEQQKEMQERHERELEQLQSELSSKTHQLVAKDNEKQKHLQQHEEKQKGFDQEREQLQTELKSKKQQLVAKDNEMKKLREQQEEKQKGFDQEHEQLQTELKSKTQQLVARDNEMKKLLEQQEETQKGFDQEHEQLQTELKSKTQQLVATENEKKKLQEQQKELQERHEQEFEKLQSELSSKTQQLDVQECEKQKFLQQQEEKQKRIDEERAKLQTELESKTQLLVAKDNEQQNLLEQQGEKQKLFDKEREQLQTELKSKTQQLVSSQNEVKQVNDQQKELQVQLDSERRTVKQLQTDVSLKTQQHVAVLNEVKKSDDQQKELQAQLENERRTVKQLQTDLNLKTQQHVESENEKKKLQDQLQDLQKRYEQEHTQLQSELSSKTQQLAARDNEKQMLLQQQEEKQKGFNKEREQLQTELKSKKEQIAASENEKKKLHDQQQEQQKQLDRERRTVEQLQSELKSKTQQIAASENEKRMLHDQQQDQQKLLDRERKTVEQLQSELNSKTQQLAAPTKPLSFDSKPRGTFKGPGRCWDVAVTPQGRLLVAAGADGLKEYDATSFREIATWKPGGELIEPDADLLGQEKNLLGILSILLKSLLGIALALQNMSSWVTTVDVLSDGRALVGLNSKQVVLLRRDVVSGGDGSSSSSSSAAAEGWRVERRVAAELQGAPRRLSAWDDRLLAVLEDRYDDNTKSWCSGPGLVLFSLRDGDKQLHRQRLDYNAGCVALTDRGVIVSSAEQVELTAAGGSSNIKSCVVDCYSHVGVRLWRHECWARGLCSDSVGRVLYAAQVGSVVALSTDNGRELSSALALSTTETNRPYALSLEKGMQSRLVLISRVTDDDNPNIITIFSVA